MKVEINEGSPWPVVLCFKYERRSISMEEALELFDKLGKVITPKSEKPEYQEPRYDDVFYDGVEWLDSLK